MQSAVGDHNKARRDLVKKAGYEVVDPSSTTPVADQIEDACGRSVDFQRDAHVGACTTGRPGASAA
jgi:hypothetical protein